MARQDIKEFVRTHQQILYTFCYYTLNDEMLATEVISSIFQNLSKIKVLKDNEIKIEIFRNVIEKIKKLDSTPPSYNPFRNRKEASNIIAQALFLINLELRVVLVLHDIIRLSDEEIMNLLSLRWGVYRHRLHRARISFLENLESAPKGKNTEGV